jgi:tRNASer (uridine44-2'-O)-methyltransferase
MELSEVSELFDQDVLRQLRCEAGGIKTVLRNSHQIFKGEFLEYIQRANDVIMRHVQSRKICKLFLHFLVQGGTVTIRDWREESHCRKKGDRKKQPGTQKYWKTKLCWFHSNHPDGCPLAREQCSFAHGKQELTILP